MASRVTEIASRLYDACLERFEADHLFYQQDLLALDVIPKGEIDLLLKCAQSLVDQKLFRLLQGANNRLAWKIISRDDAEKYVSTFSFDLLESENISSGGLLLIQNFFF
jgi:DNA-directed RNA polymerase III subunit RPC6